MKCPKCQTENPEGMKFCENAAPTLGRRGEDLDFFHSLEYDSNHE